mmetsp:Transcript_8744/g.17301  ORF Transcript_8744/g.17301 Transcript_8744/m.17301 type:complete len:910 (+) Transcript_8744:1002-3731(+)
MTARSAASRRNKAASGDVDNKADHAEELADSRQGIDKSLLDVIEKTLMKSIQPASNSNSKRRALRSSARPARPNGKGSKSGTGTAAQNQARRSSKRPRSSRSKKEMEDVDFGGDGLGNDKSSSARQQTAKKKRVGTKSAKAQDSHRDMNYDIFDDDSHPQGIVDFLSTNLMIRANSASLPSEFFPASSPASQEVSSPSDRADLPSSPILTGTHEENQNGGKRSRSGRLAKQPRKKRVVLPPLPESLKDGTTNRIIKAMSDADLDSLILKRQTRVTMLEAEFSEIAKASFVDREDQILQNAIAGIENEGREYWAFLQHSLRELRSLKERLHNQSCDQTFGEMMAQQTLKDLSSRQLHSPNPEQKTVLQGQVRINGSDLGFDLTPRNSGLLMTSTEEIGEPSTIKIMGAPAVQDGTGEKNMGFSVLGAAAAAVLASASSSSSSTSLPPTPPAMSKDPSEASSQSASHDLSTHAFNSSTSSTIRDVEVAKKTDAGPSNAWNPQIKEHSGGANSDASMEVSESAHVTKSLSATHVAQETSAQNRILERISDDQSLHEESDNESAHGEGSGEGSGEDEIAVAEGQTSGLPDGYVRDNRGILIPAGYMGYLRKPRNAGGAWHVGLDSKTIQRQAFKLLNAKPAPTTKGSLFCSCRKSRCLKLYCDCFAASMTCSDCCSCQDCRNLPEYARERLLALESILRRKPYAFHVQGRTYSQTEDARTLEVGCNCRRTLCLKKYCICYSNGDYCKSSCRCLSCGNNAKNPKANENVLLKKGSGGQSSTIPPTRPRVFENTTAPRPQSRPQSAKSTSKRDDTGKLSKPSSKTQVSNVNDGTGKLIVNQVGAGLSSSSSTLVINGANNAPVKSSKPNVNSSSKSGSLHTEKSLPIRSASQSAKENSSAKSHLAHASSVGAVQS